MNKKMCWMSLLAVLLLWLWWGNATVGVTEYRIADRNLPEGFGGFRIAQISDLHNASFGADNERLLAKLAEAKPDMVVLTGDLVDSRRTDLAVSLAFVRGAVKVAPCYAVLGNHEARIPGIDTFLEDLTEAGVTVLRDDAVILTRKGDTITLMGAEDPVVTTGRVDGDDRTAMTASLEKLAAQDRGYTILLSHRPEWFSLYGEFGMNLVFSGHAHGGQVRLPFVGGLVAPNQWFFPEYDAGVFAQGETTMVVSRGLGPSIIPIRVNNRPELVVAELHREE